MKFVDDDDDNDDQLGMIETRLALSYRHRW